MTKLLDRSLLLKKEELQIVPVDLGKDEFVYVRQMTGRERDTFEQSLIKEVKDNEGNSISYERSLQDFRAKLAVCTLCDEKGNSLLEPGDYTQLSMAMSAARLEKIVNEAQKINKISEEDKEALTKNLEGGLAANSPSASA
jgi:hypothetical protein